MEQLEALKFSIQSYTEEHREKIDESLVSLRLMKEVDSFLDYCQLNNKELASKLGYSESYISQLMSGVKKVNMSFINRFEKEFDIKIDFKFFLNKEKTYLQSLPTTVSVSLFEDDVYHMPQPFQYSTLLNSPTVKVLSSDRISSKNTYVIYG